MSDSAIRPPGVEAAVAAGNLPSSGIAVIARHGTRLPSRTSSLPRDQTSLERVKRAWGWKLPILLSLRLPG